MKFDFTITVGDILMALSICVSVSSAGWLILRKLSRVLFWFEEFPPHRHTDDKGVIYPKGMRPEPIDGEHLVEEHRAGLRHGGGGR